MRRAVCEALHSGAAKNAAAALRQLKAPGAAIKDPTETAHGRIADAWARAGKEARRRFVSDYRDELLALLDVDPGEVRPTGEIVDFQTVRASS